MNLIAMTLLAPTLGLFETHLVLLDQQVDDRSYPNTIVYFATSYVFLAGGIGIATLVHGRRHPDLDAPARSTDPNDVVTDRSDARNGVRETGRS